MIKLAEIYRSDKIESIHYGYVAITDPNGSKFFGDYDFATYTRSLLKPIQAKVCNELSGQLLDNEYLAIAIASHTNTDKQISVLQELCKKYQIKKEDLYCANDLTHNCAGKHLAHLIACQKQNWDIKSYFLPNHPLQIAIKKELLKLCPRLGLEPGIDGCGLPTYHMPLSLMSEIFCAMIQDPAYQGLIQTMNTFSEYLASPKHIEHQLMSAYPNQFIAKGGAEGLLMLANLNTKIVFVIKTLDGSNRIKGLFGAALLKDLKLISTDLNLDPKIYNSNKDPVGFIKISSLILDHGRKL